MDDQGSANPFVQQTMLRDAEQFVGRRVEPDQIFNLLKMMQGISLADRLTYISLAYEIRLGPQQGCGK